MISGPSSSVNEEDETVTFTLSANPVANRDIAVKVNVADLADRSADYVTDGDHYVLIPANDTSATLSVPINDVPGAGLDGVIVATIQDSAGYTYSTMTNSAYADIYDTDGTTPVITVTASPSTIKAAQNAIFTFSRTGDITNSLPFSYELSDSGNVTTDTEGPVDNVQFEAGERTKTILVSTEDGFYFGNVGVELRIRSPREFASATYRVGDPSQTRVRVSGTLPLLTLSLNFLRVGSGSQASFVVSANPGANIANLNLSIFNSSGIDVTGDAIPSLMLEHTKANNPGLLTAPTTPGSYTLKINPPDPLNIQYIITNPTGLSFTVEAQSSIPRITLTKVVNSVDENFTLLSSARCSTRQRPM